MIASERNLGSLFICLYVSQDKIIAEADKNLRNVESILPIEIKNSLWVEKIMKKNETAYL